MSLKMQQHMAMKQQLRMTQQLQQAIKLLQLSKMELISHIQTEMTENPTLEEIPLEELSSKEEQRQEERQQETVERKEKKEKKEDVAASATQEAQEPSTQQTDAADSINENNKGDDIDWSAYLDYYQNSGPLPENSYKGMVNDELPSIEATLTAPPSLTEHLVRQMRLSHLDDEQERCAVFIIGNLDEDGYLSGISLEEIATQAEVDMDTAEYTLEVLQELDPVGVAARDLKECLTIQAEIFHPDDETVHELILNHITHLERKNYDAIARATKLQLEEVYRAAKIISKMDPRPGHQFSDDQPQYITPDIYVYKVAGEYHVVLNEDGLPKLRVSPYYSQIARKAPGKEVGGYVRDKLAGARWLIRSIHQRQRTILRVTKAIVERQRDFFDLGPTHLKPMVLRDIADDTGLHESTISRVTSKKYVHTPQGTTELKYFFNSRITRTKGHDLASESVKERIKTIISGEEPKKPYSDQKIVMLLGKQNIKIARRTVAKYREALGILSSTQRKRCF